MALIYICPTCGTKYDVSLSASRFTYMDGNKVVGLTSESEECKKCVDRIERAQEKERLRIKETTPIEQTI